MKQDLEARGREAAEPRAPEGRASVLRRDVAFASGGVTCRAWLYVPDAGVARPAPCIVMAHGLGGTRECALDPYARRFANAGFFVLLFDYRNLGASDGEPRQVIEIRKQIEDWKEAIAYARSLPGVDPRRIGLWGTSLSGGYVLTVATKDSAVAAISAQCPMVDGKAAARMLVADAGIGTFLRLGWAGIVDMGRAMVGMSPKYVRLAAPPGERAAMSSRDAIDGMRAIAPPDWRNEAAARLMFYLPCYRPLRYAARVHCPALIIACEHDNVTSADAAAAAAKRIGDKAQLIRLPIGHFDIYLGEWFERSSAAQLEFFKRALAARHPQTDLLY